MSDVNFSKLHVFILLNFVLSLQIVIASISSFSLFRFYRKPIRFLKTKGLTLLLYLNRLAQRL